MIVKKTEYNSVSDSGFRNNNGIKESVDSGEKMNINEYEYSLQMCKKATSR